MRRNVRGKRTEADPRAAAAAANLLTRADDVIE